MGDVVSEREWLSGMSSHQRVLAQYALKSPWDISEDKALERHRAEVAQAGQDRWDLARTGLGPAARSHADVIAGFVAAAEIQDRVDAARERTDREAWDRDRVDRAERARLDVERARSRRLGRNLSTVNELIGTGYQAPRRTETVDEYARNYTSGVGSVYFR